MIRAAAALALAGAVAIATIPPRPRPLGTLVARHLGEQLERARPRLPAWVPRLAIGATAGVALSVAWTGRVRVAWTVIGALLGVVTSTLSHSASDRRMVTQAESEVPAIADAIAMHLVAGDPVGDAIDRIVASASGSTVDALQHAVESEAGVANALRREASTTPSDAARRLFALLAEAYETGGRSADRLSRLAGDIRAARRRSLTAESGRRALAAYGPILALMVPTTVLFLMYPTVVGLTSLA